MSPEQPLIDALESIMEWRKNALAYDADTGHEPRTFCEDVELIEGAAKRALDTYNAMLGLPSQAGATWQTMDTAPQDEETIVLLRVPTLYGKWSEAISCSGRFEQRDTGGFWTIFNADEALQRVEPSHWMPLPAAPLPQRDAE